MNDAGANVADAAAQEAASATREYEMSRDRHMSSMLLAAEEQVRSAFRPHRDKLVHEIENLRTLARVRSDARTEAVKAYAQRCPSRVLTNSFLPPGPADRVANVGVDKLYKAALKAHEDLADVSGIIAKRLESLKILDEEMRSVAKSRHDDLVRLLESPDGLERAFKRDPLLARAHARMKAALARRNELVAVAAEAPHL